MNITDLALSIAREVINTLDNPNRLLTSLTKTDITYPVTVYTTMTAQLVPLDQTQQKYEVLPNTGYCVTLRKGDTCYQFSTDRKHSKPLTNDLLENLYLFDQKRPLYFHIPDLFLYYAITHQKETYIYAYGLVYKLEWIEDSLTMTQYKPARKQRIGFYSVEKPMTITNTQLVENLLYVGYVDYLNRKRSNVNYVIMPLVYFYYFLTHGRTLITIPHTLLSTHSNKTRQIIDELDSRGEKSKPYIPKKIEFKPEWISVI